MATPYALKELNHVLLSKKKEATKGRYK